MIMKLIEHHKIKYDKTESKPVEEQPKVKKGRNLLKDTMRDVKSSIVMKESEATIARKTKEDVERQTTAEQTFSVSKLDDKTIREESSSSDEQE